MAAHHVFFYEIIIFYTIKKNNTELLLHDTIHYKQFICWLCDSLCPLNSPRGLQHVLTPIHGLSTNKLTVWWSLEFYQVRLKTVESSQANKSYITDTVKLELLFPLLACICISFHKRFVPVSSSFRFWSTIKTGVVRHGNDCFRSVLRLVSLYATATFFWLVL